MLTQRQSPNLGEIVALAGAFAVAVTSFLPYWGSLELEPPDNFVLFGGPTRFSVWDAYPPAVLVGVGLSFVIFGLGITRLVTRLPSIPPRILYVAGGAVVTLLLLYGLYEGPTGLFNNGFLRQGLLSGEGPVSFQFHRGPLLYGGLAAAVTILIGGGLADFNSRRSDVMKSS